jgi:hypothetical protein
MGFWLSDDGMKKERRPSPLGKLSRVIGGVAAWFWTILAGGGGLGLFITQGPLPLTNGWFALFSGIAACPLTAWLLKKILQHRPDGLGAFRHRALVYCHWPSRLENRRARHLPS